MRQILPNLYTFQRLMAGRVYLIVDADGLTLVDTGLERSPEKIVAQLGQIGRAVGDVKRILITHAHPDHVGGLSRLKELSGAQVIASAIERPIVEGTKPVELPPREELSGLGRLAPSKPPAMKPAAVDREVNDGETISEVMGGLQVVAAPGHTRGQICFWQFEQRVLITADSMARIFGLRTPFAAFTADMAQAKRSIGKLAATLEPEIICFGHGVPLVKDATQTLRQFAARVNASQG